MYREAIELVALQLFGIVPSVDGTIAPRSRPGSGAGTFRSINRSSPSITPASIVCRSRSASTTRAMGHSIRRCDFTPIGGRDNPPLRTLVSGGCSHHDEPLTREPCCNPMFRLSGIHRPGNHPIARRVRSPRNTLCKWSGALAHAGTCACPVCVSVCLKNDARRLVDASAGRSCPRRAFSEVRRLSENEPGRHPPTDYVTACSTRSGADAPPDAPQDPIDPLESPWRSPDVDGPRHL